MYLGIDIGTSGVKAVVLSDTGAVVAQGHAALDVSRPHPLWSEQAPADWWRATEAAVLAIPAETRARVQGIGLAGQMHGATLLGADDQPLRPAILWNDGRSFAECDALEAAVPDSRAITGNIAMSGFTAPKLLWVQGARAGTVRANQIGLAAQRLCPAVHDRRQSQRHVGRCWNAVARYRQSRLERCDAGRLRAKPRPYAKAL